MPMMPTTSFSLSIGTPTKVRAFAILIVAIRILMLWDGALLMSSI
jgi:hypothetical protein